jgi:hypothetical protein
MADELRDKGDDVLEIDARTREFLRNSLQIDVGRLSVGTTKRFDTQLRPLTALAA